MNHRQQQEHNHVGSRLFARTYLFENILLRFYETIRAPFKKPAALWQVWGVEDESSRFPTQFYQAFALSPGSLDMRCSFALHFRLTTVTKSLCRTGKRNPIMWKIFLCFRWSRFLLSKHKRMPLRIIVVVRNDITSESMLILFHA